MKILKLRLLNLNSLRGETDIDFTAPPLSRHQLYAIVGPTGSGKSTLLDAMTLALYGQVERQNNDAKTGQADLDTMMTHGAGEAEAVIVYEAGGRTYQSKWTSKRARGKADGRLQQDKMQVGVYDPATEKVDILTSSKRGVPLKNEELTGLNYDQFVRAVILTQGEFARFLRSKTAEKAGILEKITGTDIYARLGRVAFQRYKDIDTEYEALKQRIQDVQPLSEEQRAGLEAAVIAKEKEVATAKKALAELTSGLEQYAGLDKLEQDAEANQNTRAEWRTRQAAAAPRREKLRLHEAVSSLAVPLEREDRLTREMAAAETRLETLRGAKTEGERRVETARKALLEATDKLEKFNRALPERERTLAAAEQLETELSQIREREAGIATERKNWERDNRQLLADRAKIEKDRRAITEQLAGRKPEALQPRVNELRERIGELRREENTLQRRAERARLTGLIELRTKELAHATERAGITDLALAKATEELRLAQEHLEFKLRTRDQAKLHASLAEHRAQLSPGEPCPLCGSREHPLLEGYQPTSDDDFRRMEMEINQAQIAVTQGESVENKARREQATLAETVAGLKGRAAALEEELLPFADLPAEPATLVDIQTGQKTLAKQLSTAEEKEKTLSGLLELLPKFSQLNGQLEGCGDRSIKLSSLEKSIQQREEEVRGRGAQVQSELRALLGDRSVAAEREAIQRERQALQSAQVSSREQFTERNNDLKLTAAQLQTTNEAQTERSELLNATKAELAPRLAELDLTPEAARRHLLAPEAADQLRADLKALDEEGVQLTAVAERIKTQRAELQAQVEKLPPRAELRDDHALQSTIIDEETQLIGGLREQLRADDERRANAAAQTAELQRLELERTRRARLNDLIGSATGDVFRGYAQAITLRRLVALANVHLETINPRYRMEYAPPPEEKGKESLTIVVVDGNQNDNRRAMSTLSGGETFLLSLALALGLSDLASGKRLIQSLFIDEGFGSLDPDTLDQAMTTLEQLRERGKTIGLISHVREIRERVACRIVLEKLGDGVSRVRVE